MSSDQKKFAVKSKRVVSQEGVKPACVVISGGIIAAVQDEAPSGCPVENAGDNVIMAGLVDSHVHINEPGRTEWEGFDTATRAAAAGGITTLIDMPLNCIPVTTTLDAFNEKLAAVEGRLWVDCGFYGGLIPGNNNELEALINAGVFGFKCFLIHSGIDDFPNVTEKDLHEAMPILARHKIPLLVHAELHNGSGHQRDQVIDSHRYFSYLSSRPRRWEDLAIALMVKLCRHHNCKVHIVHLSSADALPIISQARNSGLAFSVETCPHYLTLAAEEIPDGDTRYKCAPPIRERENCERLWAALKKGLIDFVVSDHSPCTPELKLLQQGDFHNAWGGISSVQFGLPLIWTEAHKRGFTIEDVANWMSKGPAAFLGLQGRKGAIAAGHDADLVVWNPEARFTVTQDMIHHRHKLTPHEGRSLYGVVEKTIVRGTAVYEAGNFLAPAGSPVLRHIKGGGK